MKKIKLKFIYWCVVDCTPCTLERFVADTRLGYDVVVIHSGHNLELRGDFDLILDPHRYKYDCIRPGDMNSTASYMELVSVLSVTRQAAREQSHVLFPGVLLWG